MKKIIISLLVVFAAIACALAAIVAISNENDPADKLLNAADKSQTPKNIVATVNGDKIYQETVDFLLAANEFSKSNLPSGIQDPDALSYYENATEKSIIDECIKKSVILAEAKRLGLEADYDEAYQMAAAAYNASKQANDEGYAFIQNHMNNLDMTEKEYLDAIGNAYQSNMTRSNLYKEFIKDKTGTDDELMQQFELYVDELISNADIVKY